MAPGPVRQMAAALVHQVVEHQEHGTAGAGESRPRDLLGHPRPLDLARGAPPGVPSGGDTDAPQAGRRRKPPLPSRRGAVVEAPGRGSQLTVDRPPSKVRGACPMWITLQRTVQLDLDLPGPKLSPLPYTTTEPIHGPDTPVDTRSERASPSVGSTRPLAAAVGTASAARTVGSSGGQRRCGAWLLTPRRGVVRPVPGTGTLLTSPPFLNKRVCGWPPGPPSQGPSAPWPLSPCPRAIDGATLIS